tara:strand:- start:167 stop:388 length:222 start_codon:yes stop_codon:yes gene_type:complete
MVGVIDWSWWIISLPLFLIIFLYASLIFLASIQISNTRCYEVIKMKEDTIRRLKKDNETLAYLVKKLRKSNRK